ncbi:hypothetical protein NSE01_36850 [Novosphingobium sediminis]|uniref:Uncharacterized protein n=1 Tax=Novosphingobium sediminis TaxID=707214 RepID=A0A512AQ74_9SPHN|nr:hypothetical protein [Novosphingobium sediminis]GEO01853.1 hypothetical protein NSE01_36850 [Novosphingobium sediminis]
MTATSPLVLLAALDEAFDEFALRSKVDLRGHRAVTDKANADGGKLVAQAFPASLNKRERRCAQTDEIIGQPLRQFSLLGARDGAPERVDLLHQRGHIPPHKRRQIYHCDIQRIAFGHIDPRERACIADHFVHNWGIDRAYVSRVLDALARRADGILDEREELAVEAIERVFAETGRLTLGKAADTATEAAMTAGTTIAGAASTVGNTLASTATAVSGSLSKALSGVAGRFGTASRNP